MRMANKMKYICNESIYLEELPTCQWNIFKYNITNLSHTSFKLSTTSFLAASTFQLNYALHLL